MTHNLVRSMFAQTHRHETTAAVPDTFRPSWSPTSPGDFSTLSLEQMSRCRTSPPWTGNGESRRYSELTYFGNMRVLEVVGHHPLVRKVQEGRCEPQTVVRFTPLMHLYHFAALCVLCRTIFSGGVTLGRHASGIRPHWLGWVRYDLFETKSGKASSSYA